MATLSTPELSEFSISFKDLIPPPRVIGTNISLVILLIRLNKLIIFLIGILINIK